MNKAKLIVANWKMNFFYKQAYNFCKKIISNVVENTGAILREK